MSDEACSDLRLDRLALVGRPRKLLVHLRPARPFDGDDEPMHRTPSCQGGSRDGPYRTPNARNAPQPGRLSWESDPGGPRRFRLQITRPAIAAASTRPRPSAIQPHGVSSSDARLRRHCLRRARVRCRRRRRRGLTRRGRSLGIPQRSQRNAEREDGPGGVVLRRPTGRVGGDRGRRQRLGRRRVGRLRLDLRGRGLRGRCSVGRHGLDLGGGLGLRRRVDSVTVVVDADVVPGDVSVGLGRVGSVTDPVGRVTLLSGGSPEPSPPQPPRR